MYQPPLQSPSHQPTSPHINPLALYQPPTLYQPTSTLYQPTPPCINRQPPLHRISLPLLILSPSRRINPLHLVSTHSTLYQPPFHRTSLPLLILSPSRRINPPLYINPHPSATMYQPTPPCINPLSIASAYLSSYYPPRVVSTPHSVSTHSTLYQPLSSLHRISLPLLILSPSRRINPSLCINPLSIASAYLSSYYPPRVVSTPTLYQPTPPCINPLHLVSTPSPSHQSTSPHTIPLASYQPPTLYQPTPPCINPLHLVSTHSTLYQPPLHRTSLPLLILSPSRHWRIFWGGCAPPNFIRATPPPQHVLHPPTFTCTPQHFCSLSPKL